MESETQIYEQIKRKLKEDPTKQDLIKLLGVCTKISNPEKRKEIENRIIDRL
jgi:hypothetical protein